MLVVTEQKRKAKEVQKQILPVLVLIENLIKIGFIFVS
jgi:hypothetical protein